MKFPDWDKAEFLFKLSKGYFTAEIISEEVSVREDGYILCRAAGMNARSEVQINGNVVARGGTHDEAENDWDINLFPIKKEDKIRIRLYNPHYWLGSGRLEADAVITFIPFKR